MRIRMKVAVSGTRDGQPWPARGETVEVSDDEGAQLCAGGMADPVREEKVETAVPSKEGVETRSTPVETPDEAAQKAELERLQGEAETAGVKVDKRWGVDRLRQEIDAGKSKSKA